jgi:hypothetical protein
MASVSAIAAANSNCKFSGVRGVELACPADPAVIRRHVTKLACNFRFSAYKL